MIAMRSKKALFQQLEESIRKRSPQLVKSFQTGLSPREVIDLIGPLDAHADLKVIFDLYSWKDGTLTTGKETLSELSIVPSPTFVFLDLASMIAHYREFREYLVYHPDFDELRSRHFPLFWDGSTGYLALDFSNQSIVFLDAESENLARKIYASFDDFLGDAIRANQENDSLSFF